MARRIEEGMRNLSLEDKDRIAEYLSGLNESLQENQIDIYEFAGSVEALLRFVNAIIEKRQAALDERVRGAGDY